MPKITVYLKSEKPFDKPANHSATHTLWRLVVADGSGKTVTQGDVVALHLVTGESWRQVKDRLRHPNSIPVIHMPLPYSENLDLAYPQKTQETLRHPHHAMREECRLAQARKRRDRGTSSSTATACVSAS